MWQIFIGKLQAIITSYVSSKKILKRKRCAWVDFRTRKQLKNRYRKWKRYKSTKKTCDFVEYKKARNAAIASLRQQRVSRLGIITARHSSSGRQPNFVVLNRGRYLCSAGWPSHWVLAHILVCHLFVNIIRASDSCLMLDYMCTL